MGNVGASRRFLGLGSDVRTVKSFAAARAVTSAAEAESKDNPLIAAVNRCTTPKSRRETDFFRSLESGIPPLREKPRKGGAPSISSESVVRLLIL